MALEVYGRRNQMRDQEIIALYWGRDETAIQATHQKYGNYLFTIAYHILSSREDAEESLNDAYLTVWNTIPPERPRHLPAFLSTIVRQRAIDVYRTRNRQKRRDSQYALSLEELSDCVSSSGSPEEAVDQRLLAEAISRYLKTVSRDARDVFLGRYYFMDPIQEIAKYCGFSPSKTKSILYRTRQGLKQYLTEEGFL